MSNELKLLSTKVNNGTMTRREFMGKAAALGVTAVVASTSQSLRGLLDTNRPSRSV